MGPGTGWAAQHCTRKRSRRCREVRTPPTQSHPVPPSPTRPSLGTHKGQQLSRLLLPIKQVLPPRLLLCLLLLGPSSCALGQAAPLRRERAPSSHILGAPAPLLLLLGRLHGDGRGVGAGQGGAGAAVDLVLPAGQVVVGGKHLVLPVDCSTGVCVRVGGMGAGRTGSLLAAQALCAAHQQPGSCTHTGVPSTSRPPTPLSPKQARPPGAHLAPA